MTCPYCNTKLPNPIPDKENDVYDMTGTMTHLIDCARDNADKGHGQVE